MLGKTCPSLYDLRNLFQVNVEEGRHLWAMVYLLHAYFGRDGREEAEMLLERHSGDQNNPRILGTFNELISDWLSFFCFTYFTDRDGKYQLKMLAESGFDPLARTCEFMLTEEAHHMFVGETGLGRVMARTCEVMNELKTDDSATIRTAGAIDLPTVQRYVNFWFSSSLDLFGSDVSTNAANFFANGLKGRPDEDKFDDDHVCREAVMTIEKPTVDGMGIENEEVTVRNAMNVISRDAYAADCEIGVVRWNRAIKKAGINFEIKLPHQRFRRNVGVWAGFQFTPEGKILTAEEWQARKGEWVPSEKDRAFIQSLMKPVTDPGKMAGWIVPPARGINNLGVDYEYVHF
jgi:benzoyl-CoA 2,3-dioxygenase component B